MCDYFPATKYSVMYTLLENLALAATTAKFSIGFHSPRDNGWPRDLSDWRYHKRGSIRIRGMSFASEVTLNCKETHPRLPESPRNLLPPFLVREHGEAAREDGWQTSALLILTLSTQVLCMGPEKMRWMELLSQAIRFNGRGFGDSNKCHPEQDRRIHMETGQPPT